MEFVIEVNQLKKHYNNSKIKALDGVSFKLKQGRVYGLIGPNGAGKTTLVKSILGSIHPTEGSISIFGEHAGSIHANQKIGYVSEKTALPFNEEPYEYLVSMAVLSKLNIKEIKPIILSYLKQFGLERFAYVKMKRFSSGMKKKVQVIAALLNNPSIMVLDEPTANLDPKVHFEIFNFIKETCIEKNITVLLCSHNLFELEKIVDDIIMIKGGKLIIQGGFEEIMDRIKNDSRELIINTSNNEMMLNLLSQHETKVLSMNPITLHHDNLNTLKQIIVEHAYKNHIIIDDLHEAKESLFELFNYFNEEEVK